MGRNGRHSLVVLILLCIALACDGGSGNSTTTRTIGPEGGTITSSDGRLTLIIPEGALDEDTEISIKRIDSGDLPPEFGGIETERQYELGPDGLEFNIPIEVELLTDQEAMFEDGSISFDPSILLTSLNGIPEALENLETGINEDDNTISVTGTLDHFSPLVEERGSYTVTIENVPSVIGINVVFTVIVSVTVNDTFLFTLTDALYTDISIEDITPFGDTGLVSEDIPFSPDDSEPLSTQVHKTTFDYICLSSEATTGIFGASIIINALLDIGTSLGLFDVPANYDVTLAQSINCPAGGPPAPTPPPPPIDIPELNIEEILAQFELNCQSTQDTFQIFTNFGGSPFVITVTIDLNNENRETSDTRGPTMTDVIITTPDDLFAMEGQLMDLSDGTFGLEAEGSGFLGGMPPVDANIRVQAEDWVFDLDDQDNVILREGDLRLNFPELPLDSQSSLAECDGIRIGD